MGDIADAILADSITLGEGIIGAPAATGPPESVNDVATTRGRVPIPGTEDQRTTSG